MRNTIHKYKFHEIRPLTIKVTMDFEILDVKNQQNEIVVYIAEEHATPKLIELTFYVISTGEKHDIVSKGEYISTVILFEGDEVYHIYRER